MKELKVQLTDKLASQLKAAADQQGQEPGQLVVEILNRGLEGFAELKPHALRVSSGHGSSWDYRDYAGMESQLKDQYLDPTRLPVGQRPGDQMVITGLPTAAR
jgi:hypothetical protein